MEQLRSRLLSAGDEAEPRDGAAAPKPAASPEKPPAAITDAKANLTTDAKFQAPGQKANIAPGSSSKKPADPHAAGSITHVNPYSDAGTTP